MNEIRNGGTKAEPAASTDIVEVIVLHGKGMPELRDVRGWRLRERTFAALS